MAKIINFLEAKTVLDMDRLKTYLKRQQAEKEGQKPPIKKAKTVSALPGEAIPPEYLDLRPYLQRDGLILLGWGLWEDGPYYLASWIKSCSKYYCYRSDLVRLTDAEAAKTMMPQGRGRMNYADEGQNLRYSGRYVQLDIADVVFYAAPDLNSHIIPAFTGLLRVSGVTVDFDYQFSLGTAKELEFKREETEIAARMENIAKDGGLA